MGPLQGVRIVELAQWVAGPGAAAVLCEWGADVIKVEATQGDPMRAVFQASAGLSEPSSPPFDLDNRGKRSVVIDVRTEAGRADFERLLADADVFVTNLRPGALERLDLDPDAVRHRHPTLIYASLTGYGRVGPDVDRAGYDAGAFWARSGLAGRTVPEGVEPPSLRSGTGDHVTAMNLVAGVCAALFQRERTGVAQLVETSLLRSGLYCMGWDLGIELRFGKLAPTAPRTQNANPMFNCYKAGDDLWFWLLGLEADRHWGPVTTALGRPDLAADERFADARGRRKHGPELIGVLDAAFATQPREFWTDRFDEADVWWAPVHRTSDVVLDPQVIAIGGIVSVPEAPGATAHRGIATPVDFGGVQTTPRGGVPGLGEHTAEVLAS